ncbi:hypothetical protein EDB19DRAFT_1905275 [Suillus lakei]|nr:hypothetical protein EDB19DRAFT_1905275 [Suillus lakei]
MPPRMTRGVVRSYAPLQNYQDDQDPILSNATPPVRTGAEFYDPSLTTRRYALVGVAFSSIISLCCVTTGIVILATHGVSGMIPLMTLSGTMQSSALPSEILSLMLNLLVTICTESTGFIHSISLRFALVSESRLRFNTNLRLLTAAHGWRNPNGALCNGIMAVLLIISYTSSSLIVFRNSTLTSDGSSAESVAVAGFPILFLGLALLLQNVIALLGLRAVEILTWSSSPFDLTAALVHHMRLTPAPFRCMCGVSNGHKGPSKPSYSQPSAFKAHASVEKVVGSLWCLVTACAFWGLVTTFVMRSNDGGTVFGQMKWTLFPNNNPGLHFLAYETANIQWWIGVILFLAVIQGPMTLGLHCAELAANVIQNENQWRCATGKKGLKTATNPLKASLASPLGLILLVLKPALHWMFSLAFSASGSGVGATLQQVGLNMNYVQIWNLGIALCIFAGVVGLRAVRRPRGPQPVTYGHLQTLANLVDEWSPVMWWGHKEDGTYCHAGTSNHPLPDVKMDCVYAGSGVGSPSSVS